MKTYLNTDTGNGFDGVIINPTIQSEISKRLLELDEMNTKSNWSKEMEAREVVLENEISELQDAQEAFQK